MISSFSVGYIFYPDLNLKSDNGKGVTLCYLFSIFEGWIMVCTNGCWKVIIKLARYSNFKPGTFGQIPRSVLPILLARSLSVAHQKQKYFQHSIINVPLYSSYFSLTGKNYYYKSITIHVPVKLKRNVDTIIWYLLSEVHILIFKTWNLSITWRRKISWRLF